MLSLLKISLIIYLAGYVQRSNRLCLGKYRHLKYLIAKKTEFDKCPIMCWNCFDFGKSLSAKVPAISCKILFGKSPYPPLAYTKLGVRQIRPRYCHPLPNDLKINWALEWINCISSPFYDMSNTLNFFFTNEDVDKRKQISE